MSKALVVLGHGSRSAEATGEFLQVVSALRARLGDVPVFAAFMENAKPSIAEALAEAVEGGASEVVVAPLFLFAGVHVREDVPEQVREAAAAHPGVTVSVSDYIGPDPRLVDLLLQRSGLGPARGWTEVPAGKIESESLAYVAACVPGRGDAAEDAVVRRLVHASGDFSLPGDIAFSAGAAAAGIAALSARARVLTDVRMVATGIDQRRVARLGGEVRCLVDDAEVAVEASASGRTRSATAMRRLAAQMDGAIVAVGNAPTALREVIAIAEEGLARPALVVGMPVGFVDAPESKAALEASGLPCVVIRGTRGGSPLAAAAVNAMLRLAEEARGA